MILLLNLEKNMKLLEKELDLLNDFAEYDNTEYGESTQKMLELYYQYHDMLSDKFKEALVKELKTVYIDIHSNFELVEREETQVIKVRYFEVR